MSKNIASLYNREKDYWRKENIKLFGLEPIDKFDTLERIEEVLNKSCDLYWNSDEPCLLAINLINGKLDKDFEKRVSKSFSLEFNVINTCVDVYAIYLHRNSEKKLKVCTLPTVTNNLSWLIKNNLYVPRATAIKNKNNFINRLNERVVVGEWWKYDIELDEFYFYNKEITNEEECFNNLSSRSIEVLKLVEDCPTIDNFRATLKSLPIIASNSVFNYQFARMEYFRDLVLNIDKYAKPTTKVILGINQFLISQTKLRTTSDEQYEGSLTITHNDMFSLENFRTVINIFNGKFKPTFAYTDTIGLFDTFKTVTTSQAGRQRLLLDNIFIKDGMLYIENNGKLESMYKYFYVPQEKRLSCMSEAPFCNNDKPKRIMMNAKLSAQSCYLKDEICPYTHRILARVGFGDIEGYTYGDSVVISKSFAKRLRTYEEDILTIPNSIYEAIKEDLSLDKLSLLYPTKNRAILSSWENVDIDRVESIGGYHRIIVKYEIPFRKGDKLTNLHGAKGTVALILADEEMPKLLNKVGNMESGALDVIISGFSTMRRGSLGQIFEAWATANDIEEDEFFYKSLKKYEQNMIDYAKNSKVEYKCEIITMPIGLNRIMRIDHHAAKHISISTKDSESKLKLGEMEKLNLISNGCENILKEISLRDTRRHANGFYLMDRLEETGEMRENPKVMLQTATLVKLLGYDLLLDGRSIERTDYSQLELTIDDIFEEED